MRADLQRLKRDTESGRSNVQPGVDVEETSASSKISGGHQSLNRPAGLRSTSPAPGSSRRWLYAVGAGLAALLAIAAIFVFRKTPSGNPSAPVVRPSIAVLPLQNLSTEPDSTYFSDGMADEISTKLSKIQGVDVAPRTAVTSLKLSDKTPADIGRQLGVRYLLEGSVRKAGNQVRINVQLIDSGTGFQVWADDFTGDLQNVFSLQEQAALKIAETLNIRLSPQEQKAVKRRYTESPQAYEEFLIGRSLLVHEDEPSALEAVRKHFETALKLDPNYAPALAGLSHIEGYYYRDLDSDPAHLQRAEQLARQALAIDPQLSEGHIALGRVFGLRFQYADAVRELRLAVQSEPDNALAWDILSWALGYKTPPDPTEAEKAARESIRLNPSLGYAQYHLGRALYMQDRFSEAMAAFDRCSEITGSTATSSFGRAQALLFQKRYGEALSTMLRGRTSKSSIDFYWLSSFYAGSGDKEKALATLQKAFDLGFRDFAAIDANPAFSSLHEDPRFQRFISPHRNP